MRSLNCFTLEIKRYYMCAIQSRDAKSCVSQARMRNEPVRIYVCRCSDFTRETQNFASLLGWCQHYFNAKQPCKATRKQAFIAHICTVSHMTHLYFTRSKQSRDAKSCVSRARIRNEPRRIYVCRCSEFTRETQDFAYQQG